MEKDVAPPLPQKKHALYPSKQEKDVENLSAQQRSIMHSSKGKHQPLTNAAHQSPRVTTHEIPQQRAPLFIQKKISNPIPSKGILRVPHLKNITSAPVKRSKSLKLTNMSVRQKMAVSAEIPVEIRRRGSLESNVDDDVVGDNSYSEIPYEDVTPSKDTENPSPIYDTPRAVQKYDMLKYLEEKRMLVRSLTTYDMRQKIVAQNLSSEVKSAGNTPVRCKLSRSNTQIDFSRLVRNRAVERTLDPSSQSDAKSIFRKYPPPESQSSLSVFTTMRDTQGLDNPNPLSIKKKPVGVVNHDGSSVFPQQLKNDYSLLGRPKDPKHLPDHRSKKHSLANQQTYTNPGSKPAVNPYEKKREVSTRYQDTPSTNYDSPSTSKISDAQKPKPQLLKKHPLYDPYRSFHQINDAHHNHPYMNGGPHVSPAAYDFRNRTYKDAEKRNGHVYQELRMKDFQGQNQPQKIDPIPGPSHVEYQITTSAGPHALLTDNSPVTRKPFDPSNSRLLNKRGTYSPRENEQRYGVSCAPQQPHKSSPSSDLALPNFHNSAVGKLWPPPYRLSKQMDQHIGNSSEDHFRIPCEGLAQKNMGQLSSSLDSTMMHGSPFHFFLSNTYVKLGLISEFTVTGIFVGTLFILQCMIISKWHYLVVSS